MKIMRYKNPLVANAHMMTSITNKIDTEAKIYFHIDWLRPGRQTFLIQHDNEDIKGINSPSSELVENDGSKSILGLFGIMK